MAGTARFVPVPNAEQVVELQAASALLVAATFLAKAIPNYVPSHRGVARRTYRTRPSGGLLEGGHPAARVSIDSPWWHFLEYGTRFSPPYRPIQRAATGLGLRYDPT